MIKPKTVLRRWDKLCKDIHPKSPGKKKAQEYAKLCGMKSIGEVRCAADMDDKKITYSYEHEKLIYQYNPQRYSPDFTLTDNENILIEYKGKMTPETRKKLVAIKRCNPNRNIYLVFEKPNNKLSSKPNSMRYWEWAERNGFDWSEKFVKEEWLK